MAELVADMPEMDEYDNAPIERLREMRVKLAKEPLRKHEV